MGNILKLRTQICIFDECMRKFDPNMVKLHSALWSHTVTSFDMPVRERMTLLKRRSNWEPINGEMHTQSSVKGS